jgi:hypothetical protein
VYAACRDGESAGVYWPGNGRFHEIYEDLSSWGTWKTGTINAPGLTLATPMAACGWSGWTGVFYAGDGQMNLVHWGRGNSSQAQHALVGPNVSIQRGMPVYAACNGEYDGVYWPGIGQFHEIYEDLYTWGAWWMRAITAPGLTHTNQTQWSMPDDL